MDGRIYKNKKNSPEELHEMLNKYEVKSPSSNTGSKSLHLI